MKRTTPTSPPSPSPTIPIPTTTTITNPFAQLPDLCASTVASHLKPQELLAVLGTSRQALSIYRVFVDWINVADARLGPGWNQRRFRGALTAARERLRGVRAVTVEKSLPEDIGEDLFLASLHELRKHTFGPSLRHLRLRHAVNSHDWSLSRALPTLANITSSDCSPSTSPRSSDGTGAPAEAAGSAARGSMLA